MNKRVKPIWCYWSFQLYFSVSGWPINIDNNFFDSMVNRIYPSELQLNKATVPDAEAIFLDLH